MRSSLVKNLALTGGSLLICFFAVEAAARLFVKPGEACWGVLFGHPLPPSLVIPLRSAPVADPDKWYNHTVVNGQQITQGDLWGIFREDEVLGYAPKENTVSKNGWWQSDNIGARSRVATTPNIPPGRSRVLAIGESFTNCSRVPQEDTWPFLLEASDNRLEVVNLGVDGYSMGQCLLRYREIGPRVAHDAAILVFVPTVDLWREINTIRYIGDDWESYTVQPRFLVENGELKLIRSPYRSVAEYYAANLPNPSEALRAHLRKYDRFYFRVWYESPPLVGCSICYKLLARVAGGYERKRLREGVLERDSEAMRITRAIFVEMNREAGSGGRRFLAVVLPIPADLSSCATDPAFRERWAAMISYLSRDGVACLDLMGRFMTHRSEIDTAVDKAHYGPKTNRLIAGWLQSSLDSLRVIPISR